MTYAYRWKRNGVNISGATANTYTLVTADLGAMITATVTATNAAGSTSATATAVGPVTAAASTDIRLQAQAGAFAVSGESMEIVVGYGMQAGAGAFALAGQSANLNFTPAAGAYTGPGDVAGWGTAYGYWGLRAYNSTKLSGTTKCLDVCANQSGAAVSLTTVYIGTNGYVDLTPIGFSPIYVYRIYDQAGTQDLFAPSTTAVRVPLVLNAVGGKPAISFNNDGYYFSTATVALPQPLSIGAVIQATATSGVAITDGTFNFQGIIVQTATTLAQYFGSGPFNYTGFALNTFFSLISVANGATSSMTLNGVVPPATRNVGANGIGNTNKLTIGGTDIGQALWSGPFYELIIKSGAVSDTDKTALSVNQHAIGSGW